jgi:hypothetical protein
MQHEPITSFICMTFPNATAIAFVLFIQWRMNQETGQAESERTDRGGWSATVPLEHHELLQSMKHLGHLDTAQDYGGCLQACLGAPFVGA